MSNKNNDDLKRQASENTLGLNPIIALRKKDLLASAKMVLTQAIKQPLHSVKHVAHFGVELKNVMFGKSALAPEGDDRRFNDPAWSQNPLYKRYLQTYLAWRKELHDWIGDSNLSEQDISRGHFVINLMTEAMAPTNSAANPAAVKRFFETGGKSLLDGLSHLAKDMVHNGGMPSQVNMGAFEVGKTLGTTEGAVVFRNDVLELIQYKPITEQVHERPLLVVPPQINKFYVFDLSPEKSLARFCLRNGQQTFIVSWRNPTKAQREWGLSTYIEALKEAVDVVTAITGSKDINMLGACSGGITCTALLGHYAALGEKKVNALTLLVSVLISSREPLQIAGEWVQRVPRLAVPAPSALSSVEQAMAYPAVQLFVARAAASQQGFALRTQDLAPLRDICRRLDALPLALELAAAQVDALGVRGLQLQLRQGLQVLTRGRRTATLKARCPCESPSTRPRVALRATAC